MNPITSLFERVRRSKLFELDRELSIVVSLPIEVVVDTLTSAITEPLAYFTLYAEALRGSRKWSYKPYGGTVQKSGFTIFENTIGYGIRLSMIGRFYLDPQGTRIILWIKSIDGLLVTIAFLIASMILAVVILESACLSILGVAMGLISPANIAIVAIAAISCIAYRQFSRYVFQILADDAEKWFLQVFGESNTTVLAKRPQNAFARPPI